MSFQDGRLSVDVDAPILFLKTLAFDEWPVKLKELFPNASFDLVKNETSGIGAILVLHARRRLSIVDRDVQKLKPAFERRETAGSSRPRNDLTPGPRHPEDNVGSATSSFIARDPTVRPMFRQAQTASARNSPIPS